MEAHPAAQTNGLTCGKCQWYTTGFNKTCFQEHSMGHNTPACPKYTPILDDPYAELANDQYIIQLRTIFLSPKFQINYDQISEEIKGYILNSNYVGKEFGTQQDLVSLDLALRQIVANRSRVSSIYTAIIDLMYEADELLKHAHMWLFSKYECIRDLKNEATRKAIFNRILPETIRVTNQLDKLKTMTKYVDDQLTTNEFTIKAIMNSSERFWNMKR